MTRRTRIVDRGLAPLPIRVRQVISRVRTSFWRLRWAAWCVGVCSVVACAQANTAAPHSGTSPSTPSAPQPTPLSANFEPVLVRPTIAAEDVPDAPASYDAVDGDALVGFLDQQIGAKTLHDADRTMLRTPLPSGRAALSKLWFARVNRVVFVLRQHNKARAVLVPRSEDGNLVPPISWLSLVLNVTGPSSDELKAWYREMGRRIGTAGRATGIVQFTNGNAMAVIVAIEAVPGDDADAQLVAMARFMRAGSFVVDAWGPAVGGATDVGTNKMNGHDGISIRDVLRSGGTPASPSPAAPATTI